MYQEVFPCVNCLVTLLYISMTAMASKGVSPKFSVFLNLNTCIYFSEIYRNLSTEFVQEFKIFGNFRRN